MSWHILASTVQSSPPENRMASRTSQSGTEAGGSGMSKTRSRSDSARQSRSRDTDGDDRSSLLTAEGVATLNRPMLDTCDSKFGEQGARREALSGFPSGSVFGFLIPALVFWLG